MKIKGNWALIPLKAAAEAKTRLSGILSPEQRARLQQAMLEDLLEGLAGSRLLSGVALYGPEAACAPAETNHRLVHLRQPAYVHNLNAAVTDGVQVLARAGAEVIAVVPGDLPLLEGEELDRALSNVALRGHCAVVPDRWRKGTNGLVFPAAGRLRFSFGPESFRRHLGEYPEGLTGLPEVLELTSFAGDIDTPEDLIAFRRLQRGLCGRRTRAIIDAIVPVQAAIHAAEEICL